MNEIPVAYSIKDKKTTSDMRRFHRRYFFCESFVLFMSVFSLLPCGHMLGKGYLLALVCDV